jgi:hypothetical protein
MSNLELLSTIALGIVTIPFTLPFALIYGLSFIPSDIKKYLKLKKMRNEAPQYVNKYEYMNLYPNNDRIYSKCDSYKSYIYDNQMVKANLLINKSSHDMAYVTLCDGKFIIVDGNIEKYKI